MNLASGDGGLSFLFQTAWTGTQVGCCPVLMTDPADPRTPRDGSLARRSVLSWSSLGSFSEPPTCLHPVAALSSPGLFLSPGLCPPSHEADLRLAVTHLSPMLGACLVVFVFLMLPEFFVCGLQPKCGRIPASFTSQLQDGKRKTFT